VQSMFTDPARARAGDPGHPDICNVNSYYALFAPDKKEEVAELCRKAGIGCTECKKKMADIIIALLSPLQDKRTELLKDRGRIMSILEEGRKKASLVAQETMREVKGLVNL